MMVITEIIRLSYKNRTVMYNFVIKKMERKKIVVVTNNHYFSQGVLSLLNDAERRYCFVWTPAYSSVNINQTGGIDGEDLWNVDVENYFNNISLYFYVLTTLMHMKNKLCGRLTVLLCYNKFVCMPSAACYPYFSFVNVSYGVKRVEQEIQAMCDPALKRAEVASSHEKTALTRLEYLVLNALSQGQSVNQVACTYQITPKRVSHHKCSGLNKLKKKRLYGVYGE